MEGIIFYIFLLTIFLCLYFLFTSKLLAYCSKQIGEIQKYLNSRDEIPFFDESGKPDEDKDQ